MFLEEETSGNPELLYIYPPENRREIKEEQMQMIFVQKVISLNLSPKTPHFFGNFLFGGVRYHCLIIYEPVTPEIIEKSKTRRCKSEFFSLIGGPTPQSREEQIKYYVPIAICLKSTTEYIDLFRDILEQLYMYHLNVGMSSKRGPLLASTEFFRYTEFLVDTLTVPRDESLLSVKIGNKEIRIPSNPPNRLPHNETCISVLMAMIDIKHIIDFWTSILVDKYACVISCNDYLLFLILEAMKMLLFPFELQTTCVAVVGPGLINMVTESIVPIIIGVNSSTISLAEARERMQGATILDIDSNILYSGVNFPLCNCVKSRLSKKLQLAKAYYFVNSERLHTFRLWALEKNIDNRGYAAFAKKIMKVRDTFEKEQLFITCVKHAFFYELYIVLRNYEDFLIYQPLNRAYEFQKEEFISQISCCEENQMREFMGICSNEGFTFNHFVSNSDDFPSRTIYRFNEILRAVNNDQNIMKHLSYTRSCTITNTKVPEEIISEKIRRSQNTLDHSFEKESAQLFYETWQSELSMEPGYLQASSLQCTTQISSLLDCKTSSSLKNIFYGKHGIVRLSTLFSFNDIN